MNKYKILLLQKYPQPGHHLRTLQAIQDCRTAALGGHVHACDQCGSLHFSFHSCRNRHCPQCQQLARERWTQQRLHELLPIPYFHVVFTLPHQLNALCLYYDSQMYDLLIKSAWQTLQLLAKDPKRLGAKIGVTAVLHTWGQNLSLHPHIHCLVTGGGLDKSGKWRELPYKDKYLFPRKVMQQIFRGKFIAGLEDLFKNGALSRSSFQFSILKKQLYKKDWVVYAKRPFAGPEQVVKYLGRYTHRIAISNQRLIKEENGKVYFHYKDYRDNKRKVMSLEGVEFLRRFCRHILPPGFRRIRHYGLLSNACKRKALQQAREQLVGSPTLACPTKGLDWKAMLQLVKGVDVDQCKHCDNGRLVKIGYVPCQRPPPPGQPFYWEMYGPNETPY